MNLKRYLEEDGHGKYSSYAIADLVPPPGIEIHLLIVLESPHIDELRTGVPAAGRTGQLALSFLLPTGALPESLGPYVASLHSGEDFRIGVMNVSSVPLQAKAYSGHRSPPTIDPADWGVIEKARSSRAQSLTNVLPAEVRDANQLLLLGLRRRLDNLTLAPTATVFTAGRFVQRSWASLAARPQRSTMPIPHPANAWWTRATNLQDRANLATLKNQFSVHTS
jgi:uracil-DNA glycosylase